METIQITTSQYNLEEKKYILDILFNEYLGLNYTLKIDNIDNYVITINNKKLIINDNFFNHHKEDLSYLNIDNFPKNIKEFKTELIDENPIILYGNNEYKENENEIYLGLDIFASSFFMLTRWEEYVNKERDLEYGWFRAEYSIAFNNNFLVRAIVNEYLELLKVILLKLDINIKFKIWKYEKILTHDIDVIFKYKNIITNLLSCGASIILRRNLKEAISTLNLSYQSICKNIDPYFNFDYIMDLSEENNLKSHFFFMSGGNTKYDNNYKINDSKLKPIFKEIVKRGHSIGFHPSYNAYNNLEMFLEEKNKLEKACGLKVKTGRQHYLRFEIPFTWQIWEESGMEWDSTLSYVDQIGFRCGTCYEYSVFNILTRKKLKLKEYPLITMETTFLAEMFMNLQSQIILDYFKTLENIIKKYNGKFTILWHNSTMNKTEINLYKNIL